VRADLLAQYRADPKLLARAFARLEEEEGSAAGRESWVETFAGRAAVLYILKSLYVRVLEDQGLLAPERIRAGGTYELFRRLFPQLGHAAYLRTVFTDAERALPELFAPTLVEIVQPSEAAARAVWDVWQETVAGGVPRFDFRGDLDTRFIGDLYQDLDPEVKARYALLQTPRFIEEFILDRTLDPALADFGLDDFKMIDPTCGSGHFLLGAFERLFAAWNARLGDGPDERWEAAKRALAAVHGADLNEYACALSRFRLLLAVVRATGVTDAGQLRELHYNVITCDALIPWERIVQDTLPGVGGTFAWLASYGTAPERERNEAFFLRGFHAVVGNPPYIAVADKKKREDYRRAWPRSASGKYSLSAPMTERFLLMPVRGGRAGIIVANNFCKRSFGKGLVEKALRDVRLDLVVDTSGAYIPGHGTPTVMLFATNAVVDIARSQPLVVAGKRGEPREPADPARGLVWSAIAAHFGDEGFEDAWIAVQRLPQTTLVRHPWSLGSDSVTALKAKLDAFPRVKDLKAEAGPAVIIIEDEAFIRRYARALPLRPIVIGEDVRDWVATRSGAFAMVPHSDSDNGSSHAAATAASVDLWHLRTTLRNRGTFGSTFQELGLDWWCFRQYISPRLGNGRSRITIAEVATNSHFVYDTSDAIFTQTAPVLTLRDADAAMYRDVAAILNSSTLEFWLKQVCFPKGDADGRKANAPFERFFVRNGTNVLQAPIPYLSDRNRTFGEGRAAITSAIDATLSDLLAIDAHALLATGNAANLPSLVSGARAQMNLFRERLVALQEELDWSVYGAFNLITDVPLMPTDRDIELARGHRPFEIALARRIEGGEEESAWFTRHELEPTTTIPDRYTGSMRAVLESRLALIESDPTIAQLEQPIYKRRWTFEPWETLLVRAATDWLLDALGEMLRARPRLASADELTTELRNDPKAVVIGQFAKDGKDVDFSDTITRLLAYDSIPDSPSRVLTPAGLRKLIGTQTAAPGSPSGPPHAESFVPGEAVDWKRVWRLQEREDAGHDVSVAVPPPFKNVDYAHPNGWRIRGKFNIANERFIVYDELSPKRYAWGGWTVHERALLSSRASDLVDAQQNAGTTPPTLEDPRRCDTQFPLWDKLDELRRTNDPAYDDIAILAQQCGRACPCDVLERWREKPAKPAKGKTATTAPTKGDVPVMATSWDPALREPILAAIARSGLDGISIESLMPICTGDRAVTRAIVESLRANGQVEAVGRGRGTRYRTTAQTYLL
jgi:hypothetical protein